MSMFATQGGIVEEYQLKKEQLLTENKALQQEIAQARNLDYIRKESEKVGYVDINAKEVQYLNVE